MESLGGKQKESEIMLNFNGHERVMSIKNIEKRVESATYNTNDGRL